VPSHPKPAPAGDLLYITPALDGLPATSAAVRVSHTIIWTGKTVDFNTSGGRWSWDTLLANQKPAEQRASEKYAAARRAAGLPVYVITDSHHHGPNYRPFAGGRRGMAHCVWSVCVCACACAGVR
jgi:hypothetical protein